MSADIHGLSGAYAVDALDHDERLAFEEHLARCPECQAEVASLREAATQLAVLDQVEPPAAVRSAVLRAIGTVRPLPPLEVPGHGQVQGQARVRQPHAPAPDASPAAASAEADVVPLASRRPRTRWLVAAAAAVLVAVGGLAWSPWDSGDGGQVTAVERVLRANDAQRFEKAIDGTRATIVRSRSLGKAVIIADNMPAAPVGKDYQLWLDIPGRGMVSAGLMPHETRRTLTVELQGDAARATGAGITLEPAGGSRRPTTTPIALYAFS
jgi:anti-sigma-K factor RskA